MLHEPPEENTTVPTFVSGIKVSLKISVSNKLILVLFWRAGSWHDSGGQKIRRLAKNEEEKSKARDGGVQSDLGKLSCLDTMRLFNTPFKRGAVSEMKLIVNNDDHLCRTRRRELCIAATRRLGDALFTSTYKHNTRTTRQARVGRTKHRASLQPVPRLTYPRTRIGCTCRHGAAEGLTRVCARLIGRRKKIKSSLRRLSLLTLPREKLGRPASVCCLQAAEALG